MTLFANGNFGNVGHIRLVLLTTTILWNVKV